MYEGKHVYKYAGMYLCVRMNVCITITKYFIDNLQKNQTDNEQESNRVVRGKFMYASLNTCMNSLYF